MVGGILFPFSKLRNFYHFINQFVRKAKNYLNISRQSLSIIRNINVNHSNQKHTTMLVEILYITRCNFAVSFQIEYCSPHYTSIALLSPLALFIAPSRLCIKLPKTYLSTLLLFLYSISSLDLKSESTA